MKYKHGFSLLELVIAIALTSIVSLMLYRFFSDSRVTVARITSLVDWTHTQELLYHQLERDISGIYAPRSAYPEESDYAKASPFAKASADTSTGKQEQAIPEPKPDQKVPATAPEKKVEKKPKLEHVLQVTVENDMSKKISLVTTNPWIGYGEITPRLVRVTYTLVAQDQPSTLFKLMRKESTQLSDKDDKDTEQGVELIADLKKFSCTMLVKKEDKDEKKQLEYQSFNVWGTEQQQKTKRLLPDYIQVTGIWGDTAKKQDRSFKFLYPIESKEFIKTKDQKDQTTKATPAPAQKPAPTSPSKLPPTLASLTVKQVPKK